MSINNLHVSYSAGSSDGGISTVVSELIASQNCVDLDSSWLTEDSIPLFARSYILQKRILNLSPDILHIHGLWRNSSRIAPSFSPSIPYVIAPHGMLDAGALAISSFKKKLALRLWENHSLSNAACAHALCHSEASDIASLIPNVPVL